MGEGYYRMKEPKKERRKREKEKKNKERNCSMVIGVFSLRSLINVFKYCSPFLFQNPRVIIFFDIYVIFIDGFKIEF